ncbi:MAG TPA: hypothetical protein VMU83_01010 [Hanamia sp.]|nr:hypothetical protein [Hanamia sp.]
MKKIIVLILVLCMGIIIYLFIKEQFKGITLSYKENTTLSITYLITGISLLILFRINYLEKKKEQDSNN